MLRACMFLKNASFGWFLDAHMNILINLENPSPDDKNLVSVVQVASCRDMWSACYAETGSMQNIR